MRLNRMTTRAILALIPFLTFISITEAQTTVSGRVVDAFLGVPLQGVWIEAGGAKVQTDARGNFRLEAAAESLEISVRRPGYETRVFPLAGWTGERTLALKPGDLTLPEIVVRGYDGNRKLLETAGGLALLTEKDFDRTNRVNAASVLNTVAGVRVDQAFMEDSRVSIRGEGLRASYGNRDIGFFLDEIPLNEADGFARIEGLDLFTLGEAEILKGPASTVYGAGVGGVMSFKTLRPNPGETTLEASGLAGDFGLYRAGGVLKADLGNAGLFLAYGNQWFGGWVDHTGDTRSFATALGTFYPSDRDSLTVLVNQSHQVSRYNAAETLADFQTNPTLGDPNATLYDFRRDDLWTRFGVSNRFRFNDQWENSTSVFTSSFALDHPYAFGFNLSYLIGQMQSVGGRTRWTFKPTLGDVETAVSAGGSWVRQYRLDTAYDNNFGVPGTLGAVQNTEERQLNLFLEGNLALEEKAFLTAGLNYNETVYSEDDRLALTHDEIDFTPAASLRVAASRVFNGGFSVYLNISQGFSPPILAEATDLLNGGFLKGLKPETATHFEVGSRGRAFDGRLEYDVALYDLEVSQELIPQSGPFYTTYYVNAGKTAHQGLEVTASTDLSEPGSLFTLAKPRLSYSLQLYRFLDFVRDGVDNSGKRLTGNPQNLLNLGLDVETGPGFYFSGDFRFVDAYPITDDNSAWNQAYGLLSAKLGFHRAFDKALRLDVYFGGENLSNQLYAGRVIFNSPTGNFYEPGLPRNAYTGCTLGVFF